MSEFAWSEPGKKLLLEFENLIIENGGYETLLEIVQKEWLSNAGCRKKDCIFCRLMHPKEKEPIPEFIMSSIRGDLEPSRVWSDTDKDLLLKNIEVSAHHLTSLFAARTEASIDSYKTILRRHYGIIPPKRRWDKKGYEQNPYLNK